MAKKGAYPKEFSRSAQAALERFISRRAAETGVAVEDLPGTTIGGWLGISQSLVSKLRSGVSQMQLATAIRLADELGVTLNDVMYYSGRPVTGVPQPTAVQESHVTEKPRRPPR